MAPELQVPVRLRHLARIDVHHRVQGGFILEIAVLACVSKHDGRRFGVQAWATRPSKLAKFTILLFVLNRG
jgi:hypothetical protein